MRLNLSPVIKFVSKNATTILASVAIGASVSACVETAKATVKSVRDVDTETEKKGANLTRKEIVKVTWKNYIPAGAALGLSIGCGIACHRLHVKRGALLAGELATAVSALDTYKDKAKEIVGEEKAEEITKAVVEETKADIPQDLVSAVDANGGNVLFYDLVSARYFKSDKQTVREVVNDLNERLMTEHYISVNDFYYELGLPKLGIDLGWNLENGLISVDLGTMEAEGDIPCYYIDFKIDPRYEYY